MAKQLRELQELYQKDDKAGVLAKADEIAAMPSAGAYDKAYAFQIAGNAAADLDDQAKAMDYFRRAVEADALDNDAHYATMFNLAVIQASEDRNAEALATIDRFLAETKSTKPEQTASSQAANSVVMMDPEELQEAILQGVNPDAVSSSEAASDSASSAASGEAASSAGSGAEGDAGDGGASRGEEPAGEGDASSEAA